ncbi:hypothetical protein [Rufibacter psychrotolerans]|uniref:hypothetical protein n=1 Tax=Rufibacter psychrotolerans TaxID=2812556 RepID=UPI001967BF9C|nr:hypothetical protein [Rufibacter sp. SYSU D00308]
MATHSRAQQAEAKQQEQILQKDTLNAVQEEVVRKPHPAHQEEFATFFKRFEQAIQQQDATAFNQTIAPEPGLYLIDNPGAVPRFTRVADIKVYKRTGAGERPFFTIRESFNKCDLQEAEQLPTVTCLGDNNNFSRQGCFVTDGTAFHGNTAYRHAGLSQAEERRISQAQLLVSKTVLHTRSGFKFHFGRINGQWRVLFIELTAPCSA